MEIQMKDVERKINKLAKVLQVKTIALNIRYMLLQEKKMNIGKLSEPYINICGNYIRRIIRIITKELE